MLVPVKLAALIAAMLPPERIFDAVTAPRERILPIAPVVFTDATLIEPADSDVSVAALTVPANAPAAAICPAVPTNVPVQLEPTLPAVILVAPPAMVQTPVSAPL